MSSLEKNLKPTPRTWEEATRNADYACSIQTFKTETQEAWEFLLGAVYSFVMVGMVATSAGLIIYYFFGG
jgi:hypothetical protein